MKTIRTIAFCLASLCMAGALAACGSSKNAQGQKNMAPAKKGYAETGKYRNYLKELGIPQADIPLLPAPATIILSAIPFLSPQPCI